LQATSSVGSESIRERKAGDDYEGRLRVTYEKDGGERVIII
jgi:hypothetical protein